MKRAFILCILAVLASVSFGQIKKGPETEILKNRFDGGAYFNYEFDTADLPVSTTAFTIPYIRYNLETAQGENNKFYLDGDLSYNFSKTVIDGEAPEGADQFGSVLNLHLDPRFRFYVTEESLKKMGGEKKAATEDDNWDDWQDAEEPVVKGDGKWFFQVGLPITYEQITPQYEDADGVSSTFVDASIDIGFFNKKVDLVKKTPWGRFEKGWMAYGLFDYRLVETYYDEDSETMPMAVGAAGDYSYELDNWISDATIKGFMTVKYQMADEAIRLFPWEYTAGYMGKYLDFSFGFEYAQDLNEQINLTAFLAGTTWQLGDDPESDSINSMKFGSKVNYYPSQLPELCAFAGFGFETHLKEEDSTPNFNFTIGAEYRFDVIAFKNRPKTEKADTEEDMEEDYEW